MRTDNTATALVLLLVLVVFIFTLSSLAQVEPESPDTWPVYFGATYTPIDLLTVAPNQTRASLPTDTGNVIIMLPPFPIYATPTRPHPVIPYSPLPELTTIPQSMTPTIRTVIIPRWP